MTRFISFIRGALISPEFAVILIASIAYAISPSWLSIFNTMFLDLSDEARRYISVIPVLLLSACLIRAKSILLPPDDKTGILQKWDKYLLLKDRVITGLVFQLLFACVAVLVWLFSPKSYDFSIFWAASVVGAIIGAATLLLASIFTQEIIRSKS